MLGKLLLAGLIALVFILLFIRNDDLVYTNIKYLLTDTVGNTEHSNLLLGSSTIVRLDTALIDDCGSWLNRGIGNSQLKDVIRYIQYSPNIKLDNILIYAGENDLSYGVTIKQTVERYKELLSLIIKKYPDAIIHVVAIKLSPKRNAFWDAFKQVNLEVENYVSDFPKIIFYHPRQLQSANALDDLYTSDGIHLNTLGYLHFINGLTDKCKKR